MNPRLALLLLCASLVPAVQAYAKDKVILPDACGDNSVKFDVTTLKDQPAPAPPAEGTGQIVFIQATGTPRKCSFMASQTQPCRTARFGVDGVWVGATRGNSYFVLSVDPGVHHLCSAMGKDIGFEALTVEAGKVYYYQARFTADGVQYGISLQPNDRLKRTSSTSLMSEDEGKFRIKISELATWKTK